MKNHNFESKKCVTYDVIYDVTMTSEIFLHILMHSADDYLQYLGSNKDAPCMVLLEKSAPIWVQKGAILGLLAAKWLPSRLPKILGLDILDPPLLELSYETKNTFLTLMVLSQFGF